jgi:hypothetical protein
MLLLVQLCRAGAAECNALLGLQQRHSSLHVGRSAAPTSTTVLLRQRLL